MQETVPEWLRKIQFDWSLTPQQLANLLHVDAKRLSSAMDSSFSGTLPPGLEAAAPLIAIYRRLSARYPEAEDQVKWLFTEHKEMGNTKPIDVASSSLENLYWVGYFLDSAKDT